MGGTLSKADPSATVEVVGAGYSRTGTSSLQLALEKLINGPVYHGGTQIWLSGNDARVKLWGLACDAKYVSHDRERTLKLVREACRGYAGLVDIPCILFIPELVELFPDAKFVLNTRDPQKWWTSFGNLLGHVPTYFTILTAPRPGIRWIPKILRGFRLQADELLNNSGGESGRYGPELLEAYHEHIMKTVPPEKLLVMELKEGWVPLAEFLGKASPVGDFPRVNESQALDQQAKALLIKLLVTWLGIVSVAGGSLYAGWRVWKC